VSIKVARLVAIMVMSSSVLAACGSAPQASATTDSSAPAELSAGSSAAPAATTSLPDWYDIRMTDVRTGRTFAISDFAGKVVLVETMAEWCPTCIEQQREVAMLHDGLVSPNDVVSISLDIDVHEDAQSLKEYAAALGHEWRYAVAPLEVARALGNLYSAEYLNPPFSPMLLIDRDGVAMSLPYGVKTADYLRTTLEPYLAD
jgi:thiol-disulfide isomerase/thioredoxin